MEVSVRFSWDYVRKLFYCLIAFELLLLAAYLIESAIGSPAWVITRLVDLDGEESIAVWFSSVQLALIGMLFLMKAAKTNAGDKIPRWFLALGGGGFVFLSMDEHLELHENITNALVHLDWVPRFSGDHGVWIFVYLGIGLLLLLISLRPVFALWRQHPYPFSLMVAGAGVFVLGAVGMEIIGYEFLREGPRLYQVMAIAAEEFMEMLGATTVLCGAAFYVLEAEMLPVTAEEKMPDLSEMKATPWPG